MRLIDANQLVPDAEWDESYGGFVSYSQFQIDTAPTVEADHIFGNDIIVLPCKVGDTVWKIEDVWCLDDKETWTYHYEKEVVEFMVRSISISCNSKGVWTKKFRICQMKDGKTIDHQRNVEFADFGKTVFFKRDEAELSLKGSV